MVLDILKYMTSDFWIFIGCFMVLSAFIKAIFGTINKIFRHWNIRKHGYPPMHCNADGDFKKEDEE